MPKSTPSTHAALVRLFAFAVLSMSATAAQAQPPQDFPLFIAPGHEAEVQALADLFSLHYPGAGPKSTLWDPWLVAPALWPAVDSDGSADTMRAQWRAALLGRVMDADGYVASHQHTSIAHQLGWPFPFWKQGQGGWGWHFNLDGISAGWHGTEVRTQEGWLIDGAKDEGIREAAWIIALTGPHAIVTAPPLRIDPFNAPFLQLRWRATGLGNALPFVEWTTEEHSDFGPSRRMYFAAIDGSDVKYTMVPVYKHPEWRGAITGLRIGFGNTRSAGTVGIQALFTQYDTRHNINNANFVIGHAEYFNWTGDLDFLRTEIGRMRIALRYIMTEFHADTEDLVLTPWIGHEGRSGIEYTNDGKKVVHSGNGVGNNYWDLLPMGWKDCYATIQYYDALLSMAAIERTVAGHPGWNVPRGPSAFTAEELEQRAARVKAKGNEVFWNHDTERFYCSIDQDGKGHDYGFTFLNLEAVHYGFATADHAEQIMQWICGDRMIEGDTSTGADIYHWRFGPRATTRRNIDYYFWAWSSPESIPFGGQVQDGGAVMGFSYFDLMARLKTRGPDSVAQRLKEIAAWYGEVSAAGGYRAYYDGSREGTLQGAGTAGGLGLDAEFFESVLLPQFVVDGLLGLRAEPEGVVLDPRLPADWPELTVTRIRFRNLTFDVRATHTTIELRIVSSTPAEKNSFRVRAGDGWTPEEVALDSTAAPGATLTFTRK